MSILNLGGGAEATDIRGDGKERNGGHACIQGVENGKKVLGYARV